MVIKFGENKFQSSISMKTNIINTVIKYTFILISINTRIQI